MVGKVLLWLTASILAALGGEIYFGEVIPSVRTSVSPEKTTEMVRILRPEGNTCGGLHVTINLNLKFAGATKGWVLEGAQDRMRWRGAFLIKSLHRSQVMMMVF